jgi:hypothetical protein
MYTDIRTLVYTDIQTLGEPAIVLPDVPLLPPPPIPHHRRMRARGCRVCLGEHDQEIHDATVSVHTWFRHEVTKHLEYAEYCEYSE